MQKIEILRSYSLHVKKEPSHLESLAVLEQACLFRRKKKKYREKLKTDKS